jgi:hypothetical protein
MRMIITDTYDPSAAIWGYYLGVLITAGLLVVPGYACSRLFTDGRRFEQWWWKIAAASIPTAYLSWHFAYGVFVDVFETAWGFAILLLALFVSFTVYLHCAFLSVSPYLSDRLPKYLDYIIAVLVSLGLLQAFTLWPKLKDYYTYNQAGESRIGERIKQISVEEQMHCDGKDKTFYTDYYCSLLGETISALNIVEYTLLHLAGNQRLLGNKKETTYTYIVAESYYNSSSGRTETRYVPETRKDIQRSPLLNLADELRAYRDRRERFERVNYSGGRTVSYDLLGIVAFLLATALRILKTSLELYGGLKSSKDILTAGSRPEPNADQYDGGPVHGRT